MRHEDKKNLCSVWITTKCKNQLTILKRFDNDELCKKQLSVGEVNVKERENNKRFGI